MIKEAGRNENVCLFFYQQKNKRLFTRPLLGCKPRGFFPEQAVKKDYEIALSVSNDI